MDATPVPVDAVIVRVAAGSERVHVVAEDRSDVDLVGQARLVRDGATYTIDEAQSRLSLRVPNGATLLIGTESGRVEVAGTAGDVSINTESGRVTVTAAASVDIRTSSGKVEVALVEGESRVRTSSARVDIGSTGAVDIATESGRVKVGECGGDARVHCVSGRVDVAMDAIADVDVETVSGRIDVALVADALPYRVQNAAPEENRPPDTNCTVAVRTVTGRVKVSSA